MRQEVIDRIKKEYEDISRMIDTNFEELNDDSITVGRYKEIKKIQELAYNWEISRCQDIDNCVLEQAIADNRGNDYIGETNGILMYISELQYETYEKLFNLTEKYRDPKEAIVLYMDIENEKKYFVRKQDQEQFERENKVIVMYKNPGVSQGWNFERNYYGLQFVRRDFIRSAMYKKQNEAAYQFVKKNKVQNKD